MDKLSTLTLVCSIVFNASVSAQGPNAAPDLQQHFPLPYYWPSQDISQQQELWPNGTAKLKYVPLSRDLALRQEFYESGNIKLEAAVYQEWGKGTVYVETPNGELTPNTETGYTDIFHGQYREFPDAVNGHVTVEGHFIENEKTGFWTRYDATGTLVETVSYDKK